MDDLISRKAALEELGECPENWTDSPEEIEAVNSWCFAADVINSAPTVPAVPLDKLCEWLAGNAYLKDDTEGAWELNPDNWKKLLTKWMEEQDADRQ